MSGARNPRARQAQPSPDAPRRTRIVATIGPASESPETLRRMIAAGMNVARFNFSHGTREWHARVIRAVRRLSDRVAILQDLQGPRIRTGKLARRGGLAPPGGLNGPQPVLLQPGRRFILTTRPVFGDQERVSVTYRALPDEVRPGTIILIDDGLLQLRVRRVRGRDIICEVVVGGPLGEAKGVNVPGASLRAPALTAKDRQDLLFGIQLGVDFLALSFVRSAQDVLRARRIVRAHGADTPIIAKIERREALDNLEAILAAADGFMVARGDLGVETSSADVPILQKRLIALSSRFSKIDITATQMLQSMTVNPRPTRAEACDVANAVFDGTDAVMLSAETATGKYPVESVRTMAAIALRAEGQLAAFGRGPAPLPSECLTAAEATALAACLAARELRAAAVVVLTRSGRSALIVSERRPAAPIIALTPSRDTLRRLSLVWGVAPLWIPEARDLENMLRSVQRRLLREGGLKRGDTVVVTAGASLLAGATNVMRVMRLGA